MRPILLLLPLLPLIACGFRGPLPEGWEGTLRLEGAHFRLEADVGEETALRVLDLAEEIHAEYGELFGTGDPGKPIRLLLFARQLDYGRYHGLDLPTEEELEAERKRLEMAGYRVLEPALNIPLGHFRPPPPFADPEIALPPLTVYGPTIRHELSHYFLRQVVLSPPPWLDEGLAEYLGSRPWPELEEDSVRLFAEDLEAGRAIPLEVLVRLDRKQFYARGVSAYVAAWLLVRHLIEEEGALTPANAREWVMKRGNPVTGLRWKEMLEAAHRAANLNY